MNAVGIQSIYDQEYFAYQKRLGEFGGWANLPKFLPYLKEDDFVLDFGCGGGFLLKNLRQEKKIGIEINPVARAQATELGVAVCADIAEIPDESIDIVISEHALEHCERPLDELLALGRKLKRGGRMLFYVPSEGPRVQYLENDPNHHIYTWSPRNLGNLFKAAGLRVVFATNYQHAWPPYHRLIARYFGRRGFELSARVYGFLKRHELNQSRCLGVKD